MNEIAVTSVSSRGQVVIPNQLRKKIKLSAGSKLLVFTDGSNLLLKPVPSTRIEEFKLLIQQSRKWARTTHLTKSDLSNAIRSARHARRP